MKTYYLIRNSMLWAAYGDALGFITELCNADTLNYRTNGLDRVTQLIPWKRKLGGYYGVSISLPKGCYSDDTQLRLAVCRSIKLNGKFDFETFSKIELPVFLAYGLGVGKGTRAAVESLQKKSIQWNTNFFETKNSYYTKLGGNGAAMRIQPHVWACVGKISDEELIAEIMRDTIITHGHPVGWLGAVFHGLSLQHTFANSRCPNPDEWIAILNKSRTLVEICHNDILLKDIWVPAWERKARMSLKNGILEAADEMLKDIKTISRFLKNNINELQSDEIQSEGKYHNAVKAIDALNPSVRGSATKTALLSSYLAYCFSKDPIKGIQACVNTLGSDTDTIATMAGALLGACCNNEPPQKVLDYEYLTTEAQRLYDISTGKPVTQFSYPDLLHWNTPSLQTDFTGSYDNRIALYGLGVLNPEGDVITQKQANQNFLWRFAKTSFGQTVLIKHRENLENIPSQAMPVAYAKDPDLIKEVENKMSNRISNIGIIDKRSISNQKYSEKSVSSGHKLLDEITDLIIKNGFDETDIGAMLLSFAEAEDGIEKAISFASIIVKAKRARMRRNQDSIK